MIYDLPEFDGPHFDASTIGVTGRLARLHKGGSSRPPKPPRIHMPAPPRMRMPEIPAVEMPPPAVPAPNQVTTTDQAGGQAEDDLRRNALRRRGLASGATIFAGEGGYKPQPSTLGATSGTGGSTLG